MKHLKGYLITIVTFLILDSIWINGFVVDVYHSAIPKLLTPDPRIPAAIAFYILFCFGLYWFSVKPNNTTLKSAIINGVIYGLTTYITFGLTNRAIMIDWPFHLVWMDTLWGMTGCGVTAGITAYLLKLTQK